MLPCGGCSGGRRIAGPVLLVCAILLSQGVFGLRRASKRSRAVVANAEIGGSKLLAKDKDKEPLAGITARPHEELPAESERQAALADASLPSLQKQALADVVEQISPEDAAVEPDEEAHADRFKAPALAGIVERINPEDASAEHTAEDNADRPKLGEKGTPVSMQPGIVENFMQKLSEIAKDELRDAGDRHAHLWLRMSTAGICASIILACFVVRSERAAGQEGGIFSYAFGRKRSPQAFGDAAAGNMRSLSQRSAFTDVSEATVDDDSDTEAWHSSGEEKTAADGKPDLSGEWKMTRYEGDFDAFLKDQQTPWLMRTAAGATGYGVGSLHHIIKVIGDHFSIENKTSLGGYVREFKADGRDHDGEDHFSRKPLRLVAKWEEVRGRTCLAMEGYVKDPLPDDVLTQVATVRRWLEGSEMAVEMVSQSGIAVLSYFSKVTR